VKMAVGAIELEHKKKLLVERLFFTRLARPKAGSGSVNFPFQHSPQDFIHLDVTDNP
jgi:hypothetical protein